MGKSQDTRRKLTLAYRRVSPLANSPRSDRRERRGLGAAAPIMACFLRMCHIRQDAPQLAAGFFTRLRRIIVLIYKVWTGLRDENGFKPRLLDRHASHTSRKVGKG
jgi:hypothetical protein